MGPLRRIVPGPEWIVATAPQRTKAKPPDRRQAKQLQDAVIKGLGFQFAGTYRPVEDLIAGSLLVVPLNVS
jgi:hypothetical protein